MNALVPTDMRTAMDLASMMARAKMMPPHLQNAPGDCLLVIEQAMRWRMSPFAAAHCYSNIKGKPMWEGKIIAAAIESCGVLEGYLDYKFEGEGQSRKVTVIGTRRGETEPKTVDVILKDAKTDNQMWIKQPDQQLVYHGARVWARRWTPAVILGVYSPEEFNGNDQAPVRDTFTGTTIDARPEPATTGQIIGDEIPSKVMDPPRRTAKQWLSELETQIAEALAQEDARAAVNAILSQDDVKRAEAEFKNGLKERLDSAIQAALAQLAEREDDDFPGVVTQAAD